MSKLSIIFLSLILSIPASEVSINNYLTLKEDKFDSVLMIFLDQLYSQEYSAAERALKSGIPDDLPGFLYFYGLLYCARYNDMGDTAALAIAKKSWESLRSSLKKEVESSPLLSESDRKKTLYLGLTLLQLSYVSHIYGQLLPAALNARDGMIILKKVPEYIEAQCAFQTHEYYKKIFLNFFSWIPFVDTDRTKPKKFLDNYYDDSRYLTPIFLTTLIWMNFDNGLNNEGLKLTRSFLKKYPKNRVFRLIEADFLFKLRNFSEAAGIFEEIKSEYLREYNQSPSDCCIKTGYLSAVGNLVRVYHSTNDKHGYQENAKIWFSDNTKKNQKWLPKSLVKDLKRFEGE